MKYELLIDATYLEPKVIIYSAELSTEVTRLVQFLSQQDQPLLTGRLHHQLVILDIADIVHLYALDKKVYAATLTANYELNIRLYEAENYLNAPQFVRISRSEIINLKQVQYFDVHFNGTILVQLKNGVTTYVSRRYLGKLKQILGR